MRGDIAVVVVPDLGAEIGLEFPSLYTGHRVYAADEVPRIPPEEIWARVRSALQPILERVQDELELVDRDIDARYFAIAALAAVHV